MARVSRDDDSWKASGVKRRDERQDSSTPEVSRKGKKKNTRRWCKGVEGRKHDYEIGVGMKRYQFDQSQPAKWVIDRCRNCGKEINLRREGDN